MTLQDAKVRRTAPLRTPSNDSWWSARLATDLMDFFLFPMMQAPLNWLSAQSRTRHARFFARPFASDNE